MRIIISLQPPGFGTKSYVRQAKKFFLQSISIGANLLALNRQHLELFVQLRNDMQALFPNNKIIFNLVVDTLDNVEKRIE